jgi:hypothetical protein
VLIKLVASHVNPSIPHPEHGPKLEGLLEPELQRPSRSKANSSDSF